MEENLKYKRILLKLSGEALLGEQQFGIDQNPLEMIANEVKQAYDLGAEIAIVVGGGNIFRGVKNSAKYAQSLGLKVNAGHGLNYENVHRMHEIPNLVELNIGHSIISRAIFVGLEQAVKEMKALCEGKG